MKCYHESFGGEHILPVCRIGDMNWSKVKGNNFVGCSFVRVLALPQIAYITRARFFFFFFGLITKSIIEGSCVLPTTTKLVPPYLLAAASLCSTALAFACRFLKNQLCVPARYFCLVCIQTALGTLESPLVDWRKLDRTLYAQLQ
jgi:hypothetical protein